MTESVQKTLIDKRQCLQLVKLGGKKMPGEPNVTMPFLGPYDQENLSVKIVKSAETKTLLHTMKITINPSLSIGYVNLAISKDIEK
jgi:hypothetical protein